MEYTLLVIVGRRSVSLLEREISPEARVLDLQIDGRYMGKLELLPTELPNVGVMPFRVAIWGGSRLYLVDSDGNQLRQFDWAEPIHAAYPLDERWCLICETSVVVIDQSGAKELARYEHDEVLLQHWWSEDRLIVMDLAGRRLAFEPTMAVGELLPQ